MPSELPVITVAEAVHQAAKCFARCGIDNPALDAELLLASVLGMTRSELHLHGGDVLCPEQQAAYAGLVERRCQREPLAYIVGKRAFYDIELEVTPDVLIPRPETELLVEQAIGWLGTRKSRPIWAADIGTGSGAIAVTLARRFIDLYCLAVDSSLAALRVAQRNVLKYHLSDQVGCICGDLMNVTTHQFDLVVANLPYLPADRLAYLQPEVTEYEPRLALDGGVAGLDVIARLCRILPEHLKPSALVLLEIDDGQGDSVSRILASSLPLAEVEVMRDYAGLERIVRAEIRS